jgi:hypothetical protein
LMLIKTVAVLGRYRVLSAFWVLVLAHSWTGLAAPLMKPRFLWQICR